MEIDREEEGYRMLLEFAKEKPSSHAYCWLAFAYMRTRRYPEARDAAEKAIRLDPQFEEPYYALGEAYRLDKSLAKELRLKEAIPLYRKAVQLDPQYELAWRDLGSALTKHESDRAEGITALRRALELEPGDVWAVLFLANALWRTGELAEAEELYKRAVDLRPDDPDTIEWYAQFQHSLGRLEEAKRLRDGCVIQKETS